MHSEQLQELLGDLERCRSSDHARRQSYDSILTETRQRLHGVPLVRGITRREHFWDALTRGLAPRSVVRGDASPPEGYLGIEGVVYTSAGILYPDKEFAIVLSAGIDTKWDVEATPWDTGALCRSICPTMPRPPAPERKEVFLKYRLMAPAWREYFVHYVASCYGSPVDYLTLAGHAYQDPLGALSDHWTSRCFEVRIRGCVPLQPPHLEVIFSRRDKGGADFLSTRRRLKALEDQGVHVSYYGSRDRLAILVQRWMCSRTN
jgi:hypothetical protein